jgi:hypothetical protein
MDTVFKTKDYRYLPFYRNTRSLYEEIIKDSAALLVLPNILNIHDEFVRNSSRYKEQCAENINMAAMLARDVGGVNIPFTFDSIRNSNWWLDDCHLSADGERNKAQIVLPFIIEVAIKNKP